MPFERIESFRRESIKQRDYVFQFIHTELRVVEGIHSYQNHTRPIPCKTDNRTLLEWHTALTSVLLGNRYDKGYFFGSNLLKALIVGKIIQAIQSYTLEKEFDFDLALAPGTLDRSVRQAEGYQKGADLIFYKSGKKRDRPKPIAATDVTVSLPKNVDRKRNHPPFNSSLGIPIFVTDLNSLGYGPAFSFTDYIENQCIQVIRSTGEYSPFYGLDWSAGEPQYLANSLLDALLTGIDWCKLSVEECGDVRFTGYRYKSEVIEAAVQMDTILYGLKKKLINCSSFTCN